MGQWGWSGVVVSRSVFTVGVGVGDGDGMEAPWCRDVLGV